MDYGIKGKVIAITGAGSGIGRETARLLAAEGAQIAVCDLSEGGASETVKEIESAGGSARAWALDVADFQACADTIEAIVTEMGALYGLCNVAGVLNDLPFAESTPEDWQGELNVCLLGTMNMTRAAMHELAKTEYSKIVNIASDAGRIGEKTMVAYSAAKGGVIAFTKSTAKLLGKSRVNCNVLCPGVTRTPMTDFVTDEMEQQWAKLYPLRRIGRPSDVAYAIAFFCSQNSNWITGQTLPVNGGFSM